MRVATTTIPVPPGRYRWFAAVPGAVACLLLIASCAMEPDRDVETAPTSNPPIAGQPGAPGCEPPSPSNGHEVRGTADNDLMDVHGMFQGVVPDQLVADSSVVKFIVKMSGSGDLSAILIDPGGTEKVLAWGPAEHLSSNYNRPGDEWGTGLIFDAAGCWELELSRAEEGHASFWFDVGDVSRDR